MIYIVLAFLIWMAYEVWRAPLVVETKDGGYRIVRREKKISDLFNRKK